MGSKSITVEKLYSIEEIAEVLSFSTWQIFTKFKYWEAQKEIKQEQETFTIYESKMNKQ